MTLTRMVDGKRKTLTAAEEAAQRAEWAANEIDGLRDHLRERFQAEGVARIAAQVPEWDTLERVAFVASIWNMLGTPNAAQVLARDIYLFVVNDALPGVTAAAAGDLDTIDPTAPEPFGSGKPGWPA